MTTTHLKSNVSAWPIAGEFRIARGAKTTAEVVAVTLQDDAGHKGRGECVPYARYGQNIHDVHDEFHLWSIPEIQHPPLPSFNNGFALPSTGPDPMSSAARNALDCALWDCHAKRTGKRVWELAGLPRPNPRTTAFTLSIARPDIMADNALIHADKPVLKMKLAGDDQDKDRLAAVRRVRDDAQIIVDANEGFTLDSLKPFLRTAADLGVALIEQPLPAEQDTALAGIKSPVPLCADESMHTAADLDRLATLYDAVNIKLDKTGGLTNALAAARQAQDRGLTIMVGCMVGTSLSMAPAFMLESFASFIDLDGPLLLAEDHKPSIRYDGATMHPPTPDLWG